MNFKIKLSACLAACLLASAMAVQAQVGVTATLPGVSTTSAAVPTLATSAAFDMNGGNAVALIVTTEASSGSATNMFASFAGQPMTLGVRTNQGAQGAFVFYLLNPATTSGSFEIASSNGSGGLVYSAVALGNVGLVATQAFAANTLNSGTTSLTNSIATNGGFALSAAVNNGFNSGSPQPSFNPGSVANQALYPSTIVGSSGHLHLYGTVPVAGTYSQIYTNRSNSGQRNAYVLLSFETSELLTPISWAVGNGTWDINTSANWSNAAGLVVYKQIGGGGNEVIFNDTASGSSPITVTLDTGVSPAAVTASNATKSYTISGTGGISGGATLTKTGNGTLTLGTANTYSGGSLLNGGTTVLSVANALGSGPVSFDGGTLRWGTGVTDDLSTRVVTIAANGATLDSGGETLFFGGPIGNNGAGSLTKTGAGAIFLAGGNRYSGNTLINQGTLGLTGGTAILSNSPNIILSSGAVFDTANNGGYSLRASVGQTLTGVGGVNGDLTVPVGTKISPATSNTVGTLVFSNSLSVSGTLELNVTTSGSDLLAIEGALTVNAGSVMNIAAAALTNGSYKLIQANSGFSGAVGNFTLNYTQAGKSANLSLVTDGSTNTIFLVIATSVNDNLKWAGAGADWDLIGTQNWLMGATPWAFTNGATVTFDDSGSSVSSVFVQAAVSPTAAIVSNTVDYTFFDGTSLGGGKLSGVATLTKRAAGTLNVYTVDDRTGHTTVEAGTLNVIGHIGSGPVTNHASLVFQQSAPRAVASLAGTGSLTQSGTSTLTVSGAANYTGPTIITSGTLTIGTGGAAGALSTSAITNDGALILNSSANWNYSMPDTGTGSLRKQGTNTVTLNGANTRTGETRVDDGRVILGNANQLQGSARLEGTGTLDMNGNHQLVLNITGGGGVVTNGAGTGTNTLTLSNAVNTTYSAVIQTNAAGGGAIAVLKTGPGTLIWQANSAYAGGTEMREGIVRVISSTPFGSGPVNLTGGAINFAGGTLVNTINLLPPVGAMTNTLHPTANVTLNSPFVGTADLLVDFALGGNNDTFTMNGGAVKWAGTTNTTYLRGAGGFFRFGSGSDASHVTFDLNDSGVRISTTGAPDVHMGALIGNTNSAAIRGDAGSTFTIGAKNLSTTFAGDLGAGSPINHSLFKVGSGNLTLTGTNLFTGLMTVSNGVLTLAEDAAPVSMSSVRVRAGAMLDVAGLGYRVNETNELGEVTNSFITVTSTLALGTNVTQTLSGSGTVRGSVQIGAVGTVSPGDSIGTLTITNALVLAGTTFMELNRTNAGQTNDVITAASIAAGGTLTVTNLGPALRTGDKFKLFNVPVAGAFAVTNLPQTFVDDNLVVQNYQWTNKVALDGTIEVLSGYVPTVTVNPNPTNLVFSVAGGSLTLSWPSDHTGWRLQVQTNSRAVGLGTNWSDVAGATTTNQMIFPVTSGDPAVFFRMVYP